MTQKTAMPIPGTRHVLDVERDAEGRLLSISVVGREYLRVSESVRIYDDGFVTMNEVEAPAGLLRHVRAGAVSWAEAYLRGSSDLPERIDGVRIERDGRGRIITCDGPEGVWSYRYEGEHLVGIDSPHGGRRIARAPDGRPIVVEEKGVHRDIDYGNGRRTDIPGVPAGWHRDEQGRLWTVTDDAGRITEFYLWDGFNCLARVDGEPGEPLAAVFSLDQTGTPVRVIARDGVTRIPRDAFGEGLLAHRGVPGLFGGACCGAFFHYSARSLDPRLGSYDAPDPWHGGEDDPRRAEGFTGTLIVERPVAGPYAVCQYDPVGFADPTGNIAWYYLLSTLTWAFPNNMLTWVGYELTLNFWGSLVSGQIGRFFTGEHIYSERFGMGALQLDGAMAPDGQVYTTQHIVWSKREHFEEHAEISGFAPDVALTPTYYGTILRIVPASANPVLLRGSRPGTGPDSGYLTWTRAGGEAEAFAPGLLAPHFPAGGFHFDGRLDDHGPMRGVMTELEPGGAFATGTLDNRLAIVIGRTGLGVADGALILITNAAGVADIVTVLSAEEENGRTRIRLDTQTLAAGTTGLRLRGLGAMQSSEVLTRGAQNTHLNVTSANAAYAVDDALRLIDAGTPVGAGIVTGFEARISVDAPLDNALRQPISVFSLVPSGPQRGAELTADASVLNFPSDPIPAVGDFLTVTRGATTLAVAVVPGGTDRERRVDRPLAALGAAGAVSWQSLTRGGALGVRRDAPEGAAEITYTPVTRGTAPAAGFVGVEDASGVPGAREVTGVVHDVLVLAAALPAGPPQFTVERYLQADPDADGLTATNEAVLALAANAVLDGPGLRLLQLASPTLAASIGASVATGFTINGMVASLAFNTVSVQTINVGDAVDVRAAGNDEIAIIRRIEVTAELDRDMATEPSGLRLVRLAGSGPAYAGIRLAPRIAMVSPTVGGNRVQMPRFFEGEIVRVTGTGADLLYRIAGVAGTTLTLEGDAEIPAGAGALSIMRMLPDNPGTGGPFRAIEGVPEHAATDGTTRSIRFRVWTNTALDGVDRVGIISGGRTLPARLSRTAYDAIQPDPAGNPMRLTVQATVGGSPVSQPAFQVNEIVRATWTIGTPTTDEFIITAVSGSDIDLAPRAGGSVITGAATDIVVQRLPVLDVTFTAVTTAAGVGAEIRLLNVAQRHHAARFVQESENAIALPDGGGNLASPSANLVVVIPMVATAVTADGELTSGTVRVPDDPENWEFDRRQALVEHELRHAQQYNWFGPLWFTMFPMWILDTVMAAATDVELPAYSAFVAGTLRQETEGPGREVEIPNMQGVPFEKGNRVQIYQGNSHNEVELGDRSGNAFVLSGQVTIPNGDIFIRRRASGQGTAYDVIFGILRFLTPSSVMNLLVTLTYGSVYQLIGRIIYLISRAVDSGTLLDATVENNGDVALLADPSKMHLLRNEDRVIVRVENGKVVRAVVGEISGGRIRLDPPLLISTGRDVKVSREGGNTQFDATVENNGAAVKLNNTGDASQLTGITRIEITVSGDTTVVRSVASRADDGRITFRTALPVTTGQVKVAPYETHTPGTYWHWNSYYPATVDPNLPATVTLHPAGENDSLSLLPRDRVRVLYDENDSFGFTTTVTSVSGDRVDLEEAFPRLPAMEGAEMIVRLAKIGRDDPTGWIDQRLVDDLYDAGWVRWITDPFSQLHYTAQQHDRGSFWDYFARVGRYLLGTSAWSLIVPGWYLWDGLFLARMRGFDYLAFIEQDASEHSGDLYTSIGRIRGDVTVGDGPNAVMTVGDIAQYWFWPGWRWVNLPQNDLQDAPGVQLPADPCVMPFVTAESGPDAPGNGSEPNNNAEAGAAATEPGLALADAFFLKDNADPREPNAAAPRRFDVAPRGWVPMEPRIQRTMANYVAFTRPATGADRHRVTILNGMSTPASDRHAQDAGKQVIFYNVQVNDVDVRIGGVALNEGDTVRLFQTQRAPVRVTPNNARRYRATVTRPGDSPTLRATDELVLQAQTQNTGTAEPVEISRFYRFDPASRQFETGALRGRGMHLPTDIDIAVRQFSVDVVNVPPVVAALPAAPDFTIYGGAIAPLRPGGEVFVLVAANVMVFNRTVAYVAPPPAGTIDPVIPLTDAAGDASAELTAFLGDGRPFRLALAADDPPEEQASVDFQFTVGEPGNQAPLNVVIPIEGHFLASNPGGYQVPRGGDLVLNCADLGGSGITPLDTVQVTMTDGTPPPLVGADPELTFSVAGSQLTITANAGASTGRRRLFITDAADADNHARRTVEIV